MLHCQPMIALCYPDARKTRRASLWRGPAPVRRNGLPVSSTHREELPMSTLTQRRADPQDVFAL